MFSLLFRYLTKEVADRGYNPFVVIRPENEASQSLYKKLGFRKLYQTIRATFTPYDWREEPEEEACTVLRENFENAVRQLKVENRVIEAFQIDEDATMMAENEDFDGEETIRDPSDSPKDEDDGQVEEIAENGYERDEECLEPIDEHPEDRIESPEEEEAHEEGCTVELAQAADSNEGDGGTTDTACQDD